MTQRDAARILWDHFYEWHVVDHPAAGPEPREYFRRDNGELVLLNGVDLSELQKRRDELIPKEFNFIYCMLPKGARYV